MSAISLDSVVAAAMNRLGRLSSAELRCELRRENQLAWETSIEPPDRNDPLGGMAYRPIHGEAFPGRVVYDKVFGRCLREAFAREFLTSEGASGVHQIERRPIEGAGPQNACDALAQILDFMRDVANLSAESIRKGIASEESRDAGRALIAATDRIRALANDPAWWPLSPVTHILDWQLRMLPRQGPSETLAAHALAYASSARLLRYANARRQRSAADEQNATIATDNCEVKGITVKERKEGGQVPRSVRIQAPARQRGSVSP